MAGADPADPATDPLPFAEKLLALLDSGRFTATYKFATLAALIDVCVESVGDTGAPPETLPARQIGRRVLELFWRHSTAYTAPEGERRYLRHSTQSGDLVTKVTAFREEHGITAGVTIDAARQQHPEALAELEERVAETVMRMPVPKLQRFSTGSVVREDRFLYDYDWPDEVPVGRVRAADFDDTLRLRPGVGELLVRLSGLLRPIIEQRWATFVAERSRDVVEAAWLDDFLFGSHRVGLDRVRGPLLEIQHGDCFYCGKHAATASTEVDHFIPWSRHPDNGLHNLVAAHRSCNNAKRDSLAATRHLSNWLARFDPGTGTGLEGLGDDLRWPMDIPRGMGAARATYLWLPDGTLLWESPGSYTQADPHAIRSLLLTPQS